jgi:hypothetical protein
MRSRAAPLPEGLALLAVLALALTASPPPAFSEVPAAAGESEAAPTSTRVEQIPSPFHGVWQQRCNLPYTGESWLRIEPHSISFYESSGPVLAAVTRGPDELALIIELSGEGETWLDVVRFQLEPAASPPLLRDVTGPEPFSRRLCSRRPES